MLELADVFKQYGSEYFSRYGNEMLPSHIKAFNDILRCRTEAMGGHILTCDQCGYQEYVYHSCRNRNCPTCHEFQTQAWLQKRQAELLPVPYFHLVFTIPEALRPYVRSNQRELLSILINSAVYSLKKLAADPKYVGGQIGILCVLHTWTRTLMYHPHVHCLVPAGGLTSDGEWKRSREKFLVPVKALTTIFRARFMKCARKALPQIKFPQSVWNTKWNVYCKPCLAGKEKLLGYLSRYVYRIAITNKRILSINDGSVTFRYIDSRDNKSKIMTLPALEFMRRFLQHVLPRGFHKVRSYGLLNPRNRLVLRRLQFLLADTYAAESPDQDQALEESGTNPELYYRCPQCKVGMLQITAVLTPYLTASIERSPP